MTTKASTTTKTETATKAAAAPRIKFATKEGGRSKKVLNDVKRMREINLMSWAEIGTKLGVAPRTARRLYNEKAGREGMHHGLLPGKGGRLPEAAHCANCRNPQYSHNTEVLETAGKLGIDATSSKDDIVAAFAKLLVAV
jgi:hypothetical protein